MSGEGEHVEGDREADVRPLAGLEVNPRESDQLLGRPGDQCGIDPGVQLDCLAAGLIAGWLRHLAGEQFEVRSAGSATADTINPAAVEATNEVGIDITDQTPTKLTWDAAKESDGIITMGCGDACPVSPANATSTGSSKTRPARASTRPGRSATKIKSRIEVLLADLIPAS